MIVAAFVLSRVALYGMGYFGVQLYGTADIGPLQAYCQFDCVWFQRIIENGYDLYPRWLSKGNAANWAFMPLYPMLAGGLSSLLNIESLIGLMLVANVAFFISLPLMLLVLRQLKLGMRPPASGSGCWPSPLLRLLRLRLHRAHVHGADAGDVPVRLSRAVADGRLPRHLHLGDPQSGVMMVFPVLILALQAYGWREFFRFTERAFKVVFTLWLIPSASSPTWSTSTT